MALLAIPFWIASGLAPWPDVAIQFGAAFLVFLLFAGLFAVGAMGGGDVKMIGAVMLWIPLPLFLPMLMIMAIGGGIRSEEHTSELQSLMRISYAVFCLKKKNSNVCYTPTR